MCETLSRTPNIPQLLTSVVVWQDEQLISVHLLPTHALFRDGMPSLSSSYNISVLVPVCWLLFQCFVLKPAKIPKS